jgi:hypothetical protein
VRGRQRAGQVEGNLAGEVEIGIKFKQRGRRETKNKKGGFGGEREGDRGSAGGKKKEERKKEAGGRRKDEYSVLRIA